MKGVAYPLEDGDWVYAREAEKLCEEIATLRTALKLAASRLRHRRSVSTRNLSMLKIAQNKPTDNATPLPPKTL